MLKGLPLINILNILNILNSQSIMFYILISSDFCLSLSHKQQLTAVIYYFSGNQLLTAVCLIRPYKKETAVTA